MLIVQKREKLERREFMFKCSLQLNSETLHVFPQSPAHTVVCRHMCAHTYIRAHTGPLGLPAVQVSSGAPHPAVPLSKDTVLTGVWHTDTHTGSGASHRLSRHVWNKPSAPWKKTDDQTRQHIKKQRNYVASKGLCNQSYGFSSSQVWM